MELKSVGFIGINLSLGSCQTVSPVRFGLTFNGPVSSLGDGQLTFSGTTSFPSLSKCGLLTGILNLLFPGSGNRYSFTVSPPAPTNY